MAAMTVRRMEAAQAAEEAAIRESKSLTGALRVAHHEAEQLKMVKPY